MRTFVLTVISTTMLSTAASGQDSLSVKETNWLTAIRQTRQAIECAFGDAATFAEGNPDHHGAFVVNVVPRDTARSLDPSPIRKPFVAKAVKGFVNVAKLEVCPVGDTLTINVWQHAAIVQHRLALPLLRVSAPYRVLCDSLFTEPLLWSVLRVDSSMTQQDLLPKKSSLARTNG